MARVVSGTVTGELAIASAAPRTSLWQESGRRFRRHRLAMVGSVILLALVLSVLVGPLVWRLPINDIDFKAKLKGPSWSHPLGTDDLGQDLLARML
ncbi:MAG: ABC transporter permease, partial [Candidatus Rokuibacteriota bacterium]